MAKKPGTIKDYKTLRTQLRMNQHEFWNRIGITQSGGSRYESGRNVPNTTQTAIDLAYGKPNQALAKLAELRGVSVEELIAAVTPKKAKELTDAEGGAA